MAAHAHRTGKARVHSPRLNFLRVGALHTWRCTPSRFRRTQYLGKAQLHSGLPRLDAHAWSSVHEGSARAARRAEAVVFGAGALAADLTEAEVERGGA